MDLYDEKGERLYLNKSERVSFEMVARKRKRTQRTFALVLLHTGCRISEALSLMYSSIDFNAKCITIECLKKRKNGVFRAVPVPDYFLDTLDLVHGIKESKKDQLLWLWSRQHATRIIKSIMDEAGIYGAMASPKGLRHGFGVYAISECRISLNLVQKWLGHADMKTTAIYANAVGDEERNIAARMWGESIK